VAGGVMNPRLSRPSYAAISAHCPQRAARRQSAGVNSKQLLSSWPWNVPCDPVELRGSSGVAGGCQLATFRRSF
jgi:hypothetical protein